MESAGLRRGSCRYATLAPRLSRCLMSQEMDFRVQTEIFRHQTEEADKKAHPNASQLRWVQDPTSPSISITLES